MIIADKDKIFLMLIRRSLFGSKEQLEDLSLSCKEINWKAVEEEAAVHTMSIAALEGTVGLKNADIPDNVLSDWQGRSIKQIIKNEKLMSVQNELINLLKGEQICGAVIKGSSAAVCYNKPEFRVLGDIDYIIKESDFEKASGLLKRHGYEAEKSVANKCHTEFFYKGCVIEIHRYINGLPEGKKGEYIKSFFDIALDAEDMHNETVGNYSFPDLNDICKGLTLLLHTQNHLLKGGLGLRHLCDWAAFVNKKITNEFVASFAPILEKTGLLKFYNVLTDVCKKFLLSEKFALNNEIENSDNLCDMLMIDFITNGNFGRKNPEILHGSNIFTATTVVETKNGTVSKVKLWKNIMDFIRTSVPITQKYPIFIPLALIYAPIRYIFRVITGKRKMINKKFISTTAKRKDLYESLDIFKTNEK